MPGFLKGPKLAAIVRTLRLRKLYISRFTSVMMPFDLYSQKGRHEERALVDSGATANFIDYKTVKRLGLGSKKPGHRRRGLPGGHHHRPTGCPPAAGRRSGHRRLRVPRLRARRRWRWQSEH